MEKHHDKPKRGLWTSRLGFIMASAGSAVGLGNIWKFPYITGMHGGGAFVLFFIFCIVAVGVPIMIAEMVIGRHTRKDPVGAFRKLRGGPWMRNPFFLDSESGFDWTVNPESTGH